MRFLFRVSSNKLITQPSAMDSSDAERFYPYDFIKKFMKFEADLSDIEGLKPVFRLHPPIKGHPKKGVKYAYTLGGALGYRGTKINQLITKMA